MLFPIRQPQSASPCPSRRDCNITKRRRVTIIFVLSIVLILCSKTNITTLQKFLSSIDQDIMSNALSLQQDQSAEDQNAPSSNFTPWRHAREAEGSILTRDSLNVSGGDYAYTFGYDMAPFVLEEYNLIFFATPKVGCSVFKKLFRRVQGYADWNVTRDGLPHDPTKNGLPQLTSYSLPRATEMMTSPNWTRAIFVRDPKERFLSAYLDKVVNKFGFFNGKCCWRRNIDPKACRKHAATLESFFSFITTYNCTNAHWNPQWYRMEAEYWPYMDFIGSFATVARDTRQLLQHLGMWDKFGKHGWGKYGNESVFGATKTQHATGAKSLLHRHYNSSELEHRVKEYYRKDYTNPVFSHYFQTEEK